MLRAMFLRHAHGIVALVLILAVSACEPRDIMRPGPEDPDDPQLASVADQAITVAKLEAALRMRPPDVEPLAADGERHAFLDAEIRRQIFAQEALGRQMQTEPRHLRALGAINRRVLAERAVNLWLEQKTDETATLAAYEIYLAGLRRDDPPTIDEESRHTAVTGIRVRHGSDSRAGGEPLARWPDRQALSVNDFRTWLDRRGQSQRTLDESRTAELLQCFLDEAQLARTVDNAWLYDDPAARARVAVEHTHELARRFQDTVAAHIEPDDDPAQVFVDLAAALARDRYPVRRTDGPLSLVDWNTSPVAPNGRAVFRRVFACDAAN
ncbi:hypothetical protein KDL45_10350 [bacterium]|nr:hypothetical protein [bacterium]